MPTEMIASSSVITIDMGIYFVLTVILVSLMDSYAKKKLGGKRSLGYKVLRLPKFVSLCLASLYTIILVVWSAYFDLAVKVSTETYLGLPYFVIWVFFLVNMMRRVRAETKGKPWLK